MCVCVCMCVLHLCVQAGLPSVAREIKSNLKGYVSDVS